MQPENKKQLSIVRFEHAQECLNTARNLIELGDFKTAANRSYYAVFHSMRAVLAFDGIDMKHHSGIIAEFRRRYIKTGIFETKLSGYITKLFTVRNDSDLVLSLMQSLPAKIFLYNKIKLKMLDIFFKNVAC